MILSIAVVRGQARLSFQKTGPGCTLDCVQEVFGGVIESKDVFRSASLANVSVRCPVNALYKILIVFNNRIQGEVRFEVFAEGVPVALSKVVFNQDS